MKIIKILVVIVALFLFSCGGGGGGSSSVTPISVSNVNFSTDSGTNVISESNPPRSVVFSFNVDTQAPSYSVDLYLSRNNSVDNNTDVYRFYSTNLTNRRGATEIVLDNESVGFDNLMNYYGGKFYVKVRVSTSSSSAWAVSDEPLILKKLWTFAVYMDADNSLNGDDNTNILEMESIGSSKDVNVVVEDDNYTSAYRYFIKKCDVDELESLGEPDMASVATLEDFGRWIKDNFPADHYFIVIWDHGLGFESTKSLNRDLLLDETNNDIMSVPAFASTMDNISYILGKKIDILGIDACLMNMVEVAYQIRNSTNVLVGSENSEPDFGWPYHRILKYLVDNPKSQLQQISSEVVKDYVNFVNLVENNSSLTLSFCSSVKNFRNPLVKPTQSAIDLLKIDNLTASVNELAKSLLKNWNNRIIVTTVNSVLDNVQRFKVSDDDYSYADLGDLVKLIYQNDNMTSDIKQAALSVLDNLTNTVIANGYSGFDNGTVNGLTIWLPNDRTIFDNNISHYEQLDFAENTKWDEFLDNLTQ